MSSTPTSSGTAAGKKRGSYNCGRCGLPKKGHVCHAPPPTPTSNSSTIVDPSVDSSPETTRVPRLRRRALSFDEGVEVPSLNVEEGEEDEGDGDEDVGIIPRSCLIDVMRRLPPKSLMAAAVVSKGWRDCVRRVWRSTADLRLLVPMKGQIGFVGSVLQKCEGLVSLSLRMERLVDL